MQLLNLKSISFCLAALALSACNNVGSMDFPGVYKIGIPQGNIITQDMVDQLRPGMTKRQVIFVMGTPLVRDPYHQDRWDYIYVKRNGMKVLDDAHLTVIFEGDSLSSIAGDYQPSAWLEDDSTAPAEPGAPATELDSLEGVESATGVGEPT